MEMMGSVRSERSVVTVGMRVGPAEIDPGLASYEKVSGVAGTLKSVGSDTLLNLMNGWTELFTEFYPNVTVEVEGKGSGSAPPALTEGQAQLGPMSRAMKDSEIKEFEDAHGYKPTEVRVAVDALAVFVHKDCPLEEISLDQLRRVFSVVGPERITWGDLGVEDARYVREPINTHGRNSTSGTYAYFKEVALARNDFKATVKENPGSSGVVQSIAEDMFAMGYSGVGYNVPGVKKLRVSFADGEEAFPADAESAYSGDYPIARFLYVYLNRPPNGRVDPLTGEFMKMVYSREGQNVVVQNGFFPVTSGVAEQDLKRLGLWSAADRR